MYIYFLQLLPESILYPPSLPPWTLKLPIFWISESPFPPGTAVVRVSKVSLANFWRLCGAYIRQKTPTQSLISVSI